MFGKRKKELPTLPQNQQYKDVKEEVKQNIPKVVVQDVQTYQEPIREQTEKIQVVKELPITRKENPDGSVTIKPLRQYNEPTGEIIHFMTVEEALTEIMNGGD